MAKNDNLSDFMADIADAIRAKKGTSEPINAQDFSSEIASIETGGGGSTMEYWSVPAEIAEVAVELTTHSPWAKFTYNGITHIVSGGSVATFTGATLLAVAIDLSAKMAYRGIEGIKTVREIFDELQISSLADVGLIQITEEEFYSIN